MQIKIFWDMDSAFLEKKVNDWLKSCPAMCEIVDIKYSDNNGNTDYEGTYSVMIIYKKISIQ